MSHLDEGTLHALLDGELETNEVAQIQAHLGSCSACGLRLREVKEFLTESDRLVASVDLGRPANVPITPKADARAEARPRPEPAPNREPRPPRPDRPPEPQRARETWDQPPPEILLPDNESARERRIRRLRRLGWAAIIVVLAGAGFVQISRFGVGVQANIPGVDKVSDRGAVLSPAEATQSDQPNLTRAVENLPSNIAAAESNSTARKTPLPAAKAPPSKSAAKPAPSQPVTPRRTEEPKLAEAAPAPVDSQSSASNEDSVTLASADSETGKAEKALSKDTAASAGTEDLADVRARASEALADLDRERRRDKAAAATAALDAERRRAVARQAAAPTPPAPPTPEQRAGVYLRIGLDEASRQLGGPAHVIEGLSPMFMGLASGGSVGGADGARPVVRVVYQDAQGRLILLDQQRLRPGQPVPQGSALAWTIGDTVIWLHGEAGPDILRTYRTRVR